MNKIKEIIKENILTKKQYIILAILILLSTAIVAAYPLKQSSNFFTYEFGIIYPWLFCFNNFDLGGMTLYQCIISKSSLGISVYPQNILLSIFFINVIVAFMRWIIKEKLFVKGNLYKRI